MDSSSLSSSQFTVDELTKIDQLRQRVKEKVNLLPEQETDHFLIKWLRARGMDLKKAEEMLLQSLDWRKKYGVDTILETCEVPSKFIQGIPLGYAGLDPETNIPIFLFLMGRFDFRTFLEEYGIENVFKFGIYLMEYMHKVFFKEVSESLGRPVDQFIQLCDFEHYAYRQIASANCCEALIRMQKTLDSNYPESIHHVSLINTPRVFSLIYRLLKPFVAKTTLEKISLCASNDWQSEVASRFPLKGFPPFWGGERAGQDAFCCGDKSFWIFGLVKDYFNEMKVIKVKARDREALTFDVSEVDQFLVWKFRSEGHDISFGIQYEEGEEILPITRVDSHKEIQRGEIMCRKMGKYKIVFDNSYSYIREKIIHYHIEITIFPQSAIADS